LASVVNEKKDKGKIHPMNLTAVYWILSVALVVAALVMAAGLVAIITTTVEQIQRISGRHARD
jgi:hypothetical protein